MQIPEQGIYYSVNEANAASWPEEYRSYLTMLREGGLGKARRSALHWKFGGGFSSHVAQGRNLSLSADGEAAKGKAAPIV